MPGAIPDHQRRGDIEPAQLRAPSTAADARPGGRSHRIEPIKTMAANPKIIVVGGGLAGLSAVIKIAEKGANVDLFSIVPVKRSHSVCAQGGINAAKNLKGEGDTTWQHFDDTVYGGDL